MKINLYLKTRPSSLGGGTTPAIIAVAEGFKKHGIKFRVLSPYATDSCDMAVMWGVRKPNQVNSGKMALILERGYIGNRIQWTSCGFNGLNGRANFGNRDSPSDRWDTFFKDYLKPWRTNYDGDYVLVMGQMTRDASVAHVDIQQWYVDTITALTRAGCPVAFRPHPNMNNRVNFRSLGLCPILIGELSEALKKARWVVTFNSNSGVDAVLNGIPTVAVDEGAMAWGVTGHDVKQAPPMPHRKQWSWDMGYTQWKLEEISDGSMWDHLKYVLEVSK